MVNWIDLVIVLLLVGSVYVAIKIGLYRLSFIIAGFFGGMFLGGYLFPHLLPIHDPTLKFMINCNAVLIFSMFTGVKGFDYGHKLKKSIKKHTRHHKIESWLGGLAGLVSMLVLIWLLAVMIGRMPFAGFSNSANDSLIVQKLDEVLPPVPAIFARFDMLIDPNATPHIFKGHQPKPALIDNTISPELLSATNSDANSIVRMTGFGCGGIISGSGFVVAPNLVITNAHVIAGVKRPIIKNGNKSYEGVPVLFNPGTDVAILRTTNLDSKSLELSSKIYGPNTKLAVTGYPNGNFTVREGEVASVDSIVTSNIYGFGDFGRKVYYLHAEMGDGNSGGPMIAGDGKVAGMIFARADGDPSAGYALTSDKLTPLVSQAEKNVNKVSTGACLK